MNAVVRAVVAALAAAVSFAAPAAPRAAPGASAAEDGFLAEAAARAAARVAAARRIAPEPVQVTWQTRHLGSVTLGGPLLDLAAADLTGDGRDEILALAADEAVAIARREPGGLTIIGSLAFDELALAPIRPRDPVGTSSIRRKPDGVEWWARSSERAEAAVIAWRDGRLVLLRRERGYPACRGVSLALEEGRNVFEPWSRRDEPLHGARCRRDLVGPKGRPLDVYASVGVEGELEVEAHPRCPPDAACAEETAARAAERGYAIAVADVDRDGFPDVATSARRPAGEPDEVVVGSLRREGLVEVYRAEFSGPVAGLATGDTRGDGRAELLVAVRAPGRRRVELYSLL